MTTGYFLLLTANVITTSITTSNFDDLKTHLKSSTDYHPFIRRLPVDECPGCRTGVTGCAGSSGTGCDCWNLEDEKVYACKGTFSGGISQAAAICAEGYEICPSAARFAELTGGPGCDKIGANDQFYASLQSSQTGEQCSDTGTNDIWGCAKNDPFNSNIVTILNNPAIQCGSLNAFMSSVQKPATWIFTDSLAELTTATSFDPNNGVLCCKEAITEPPTTTSPTTASPTTAPITPPSGTCCDCLEATSNKGCADGIGICENILCKTDPFCCEYYWDDLCVNLAKAQCNKYSASPTTASPTTASPTTPSPTTPSPIDRVSSDTMCDIIDETLTQCSDVITGLKSEIEDLKKRLCALENQYLRPKPKSKSKSKSRTSP